MAEYDLAEPSKESLKQHYDARYAGDYMDGDAYSTWAHEGLAQYRVEANTRTGWQCPSPNSGLWLRAG